MACPPITSQIDRASFNLWSKEDARKISVKLITEPRSFEMKTGAVAEHGLYSKALGPVKRGDTCTTCELNDLNCPGHYGHIELSAPVYHPMLVQTMYQIVSKTCLECYRFRLSPPELTLFLAQLDALNNGFDHLVDQLRETAVELCRGEKDKSNYMNIVVRQELQKMIEEEKLKTPNFECQKRPQQRSIVERLSKIFRTFIQGQLIKPTKVCPHCGEKKQTTSLHQQMSIVLGAQGTKVAAAEAKLKAKAKSKGAATLKWNDLHYLRQDDKTIMTPIGARHVLRQLWNNETTTMKRVFHFLDIDYDKSTDKVEHDVSKISDPKEQLKIESEFRPTDLFFIDTILVPPCKFRPPMTQRGYSFEGPRTAALSQVMKNSVIVQDATIELLKETDSTKWIKMQTKLLAHWKDLQLAVHCLYDNEMDRYGKNKYPGLKQLIDKKEGLFRKNMMGKRVNFAARSVISPDPNISVDEIGVPLVFAKVLTYPQPVTPWNLNQLREAVNNGPDNYPGATSVQFDDGVTISLTKESTRSSLAPRLTSAPPRMHPKNPKAKQDTPKVTIVNRHLLSGDVLLFNRQPTLHKPSIMAFRARVLPNEKGFRLHYANCKSFNADFDGDEMNAHLPQGELARSEAYNIVNVNHQYLVPKDGSPLGGLIQDHVVAPCILTRRDQFYEKGTYQQLVFCALQFLDKSIKLEPPAMLRPEPLWTGKQVITTIIRNCIPAGKAPPSLSIKAKVGAKVLKDSPGQDHLSDCHVIISNGELLTGLMDKSNVGATQYGLIHTCYELYGGETSSNLMSAFSRLSTWFLQLYEGFTLGIADILCEEDADRARKVKIEESLSVGPNSAKEALGLDEQELVEEVNDELLEDKLRAAHNDRDPLPMKKLDAAMKKRTDKISSEISASCLPDGLIKRFPDNNLQMMIQSGAKGGTVNALQISCLLGQIELEGRRVPLSMSGRSLPSFKPYDTSPKAGGFVSGRFLTGIQPQEFFFHCMAGREGLIDTAVKTSRSGYLQRCLIKHLEGLTVHYDQTVRDSCGSVVQFLYGEDGLDIVRSQMLKDKAFPLLVDNCKIIGPGEEEQEKVNKAKEVYEEDVIQRTDEIQEWVEKNGSNRVRKLRGSGFLDFQASILSKPEECERLFGQIRQTHSEALLGIGKGQQSVSEVEASETSWEKKLEVSGEEEKEEFCKSVKFKKELIEVEEQDVDEQQEARGIKRELEEEENIEEEEEEEEVEEEKEEIGSTEKLLASASETKIKEDATREKNDEVEATKLLLRTAQNAKKDIIRESWYALSFKEKRKWNKDWDSCPDPLIAIMNPGAHFGVVPERLDERIENFVVKNPKLIINSAQLIGGDQSMRRRTSGGGQSDGSASAGDQQEANNVLDETVLDANCDADPELSKTLAALWNKMPGIRFRPKMTKHEFYNLCYNLYMKMLAQPGEAVGLLAAQSIGEPSTQMTLNTFHFAGRGEMNVTLGIPRLREILMTASDKIGTPSMDLPLLPVMYDDNGEELSIDETERQAHKVRLALNSVRLSDVLEYVDITEEIISAREARALAPAKFGGIGGGGGKEKGKKRMKVDEGKQRGAIRYKFVFSFLASKYYKHEFKTNTKEIMKFMEETFSGQLADAIYKRQKRLALAESLFDQATKRLSRLRAVDDDSGAPLGGASGEANGDELGAEVDEKELDKFNEEQRARESARAANEDDSSSEEEADEDNDNTTARWRNRQNTELDYEEAEEDDLVVAGADAIDAEVEENNEAAEVLAEGEEELQQGAGGGGELVVKKEPGVEEEGKKLRGRQRVQRGVGGEKGDKGDQEEEQEQEQEQEEEKIVAKERSEKKHKFTLSLVCQLMNTRLDMGSLVESEAKRTYIHRVGQIQRALIVKDTKASERNAKCELMIKTEGVSLLSLVRFGHILDLNSIYSNDIHAIARTYGIEAAAQVIRREMANVFAVYGIEVDSRHLSLIADYMTFNGSIRGMNRMSMEASASPFQQMSFESSIRYLRGAAILGLYDDIKSPSAALVFGRPTRGGTGLFSTLVDDSVEFKPPNHDHYAHLRAATPSRERQAHGWSHNKPTLETSW